MADILTKVQTYNTAPRDPAVNQIIDAVNALVSKQQGGTVAGSTIASGGSPMGDILAFLSDPTITRILGLGGGVGGGGGGTGTTTGAGFTNPFGGTRQDMINRAMTNMRSWQNRATPGPSPAVDAGWQGPGIYAEHARPGMVYMGGATGPGGRGGVYYPEVQGEKYGMNSGTIYNMYGGSDGWLPGGKVPLNAQGQPLRVGDIIPPEVNAAYRQHNANKERAYESGYNYAPGAGPYSSVKGSAINDPRYAPYSPTYQPY